MPQRWRQRRGKRGRHPKPIKVESISNSKIFRPDKESDKDPIRIDPAELEALRLVDVEDLSQEEAGERMGVSRGTVWRLLHSARKKIAQALTEARLLLISS